MLTFLCTNSTLQPALNVCFISRTCFYLLEAHPILSLSVLKEGRACEFHCFKGSNVVRRAKAEVCVLFRRKRDRYREINAV